MEKRFPNLILARESQANHAKSCRNPGTESINLWGKDQDNGFMMGELHSRPIFLVVHPFECVELWTGPGSPFVQAELRLEN
jgi:hypothetical protein